MAESHCPVCFSQLQDYREEFETDRRTVVCPRCGEFSYSEEAEDELRDEREGRGEAERLGPPGSRARANASSWMRMHEGALIRTSDIPTLIGIPTPAVSERATRLLMAAEDATETIGEEVNVNTPELHARAWALNSEEIRGLTSLLEEQGLVARGQETLGEWGYLPLRITARGWRRLDEIHEVETPSEQGFVAMWFDDSMMSTYTGAIAPAIEAAGYRPHRFDLREFEGRIDDEIVAQIRRSRFLVAEFAGHRGGVYYEAGFAHGLGLPVFFTCRTDAIDGLHFDVRQYNTIVWETHEELARKLRFRIERVIGRGPLADQESSGDEEPSA